VTIARSSTRQRSHGATLAGEIKMLEQDARYVAL
jgi:hypothetical protein